MNENEYPSNLLAKMTQGIKFATLCKFNLSRCTENLHQALVEILIPRKEIQVCTQCFLVYAKADEQLLDPCEESGEGHNSAD